MTVTMVAKFIVVLSLAVAASAQPVVPLAKLAYAEPEAPAHYDFQYSVHDELTGDIKQQQEARAGDEVHGSYSLVQPDGVQRIVEYTSNAEQGFNAIVHYEGHPIPHPAAAHGIAVSGPVAKLSYPAPVAKLAYPAPVAYASPVTKVAYAAPVAKVAYASPLTQVSFSSPAISYHH